jgi:serine/threonine-protein kinase RsbW
MRTTLSTTADPAAIPTVLNALEGWLGAAGVGGDDLGEWRLLAEEVLMNIVCHALAPDAQSVIRIVGCCGGDGVEICFEDEGPPFNPCAVAPPDLNAPVEERCAGGLGIHLLQVLADEMAYDYRDGRNLLTLRKRHQPQALPDA